MSDQQENQQMCVECPHREQFQMPAEEWAKQGRFFNKFVQQGKTHECHMNGKVCAGSKVALQKNSGELVLL